MLEIVNDERLFLRLTSECGYFKCEKKYIKTYTSSAMNPLCGNGAVEYLVAVRDSVLVAGLITGYDARFRRVTGENVGYFSLFSANNDREACLALIDRMKHIQLQWGSNSIIGSVSPDGGGCFHGLGIGDTAVPRAAFGGYFDEFRASVLLESGFSETEHNYAYTLSVPNENPIAEIAQKSNARYHCTLRHIRPFAFSDNWLRPIAALAQDENRSDILRYADRLKPYISGELSIAAYTGDKCLGYCLVLDGGDMPRLSTLISVHPSATLAMLDGLLTRLIRRHETQIEASFINSENARSLSLLNRFDIIRTRNYCLYEFRMP